MKRSAVMRCEPARRSSVVMSSADVLRQSFMCTRTSSAETGARTKRAPRRRGAVRFADGERPNVRERGAALELGATARSGELEGGDCQAADAGEEQKDHVSTSRRRFA